MPTRDLSSNAQLFSSAQEFNELPETPQGIFTVIDNSVPIDMHYEDRGHDTTIVFFHAALGPNVKKIPVFLGRSFSQSIPANRLFIADPSLYLNVNLRLAWYAGNTKQPELQKTLVTMIQKITKGHRVIYFGASGGGFAALQYSASHPGSLAIPVNPQTNIERYNAIFVKRWAKLCWNLEFNPSSSLQIDTAVTNLVSLYQTPRENHVLYVQNTGDTHHMQEHWIPFAEQSLPSNHVVEAHHYVGEGHIPPPPHQLTDILTTAVNYKDWSSIHYSFT